MKDNKQHNNERALVKKVKKKKKKRLRRLIIIELVVVLILIPIVYLYFQLGRIPRQEINLDNVQFNSINLDE